MNFIVGEKFYSCADLIFSSNIVEENHEDYNKLINTFNPAYLKDDLNFVYLHTMYKNQFFDIIKNIEKKFVIITHNSDLYINSIDNLPKNVVKWYSQNVNIKDDRLESLPIGLENSRWFPEIKKKEKILNKLKTPKNIKNLVYMNHNLNTNLAKRVDPYVILRDSKFTTVQLGSNGQNFEEYIDNIYNHKFVVCPEGNGIDTHRKWETLYLNSIPIEIRSINNSFYEDLPICFINSWEEITEEFLHSEYDRIKNTKWNLEKLEMPYWKNKIRLCESV